MIDSKKLDIISAIAVAAAVIAVIFMIIFGREYVYIPEYAQTVFGADIITVDIQADETDWQNMLEDAINEEYIMADVTINGKKYSCAGIRPKGNNSLQQVYSSDSDRYSFKIKFDEYVSGQTCDGLDMLVLNNMLGDATYMKEYTAFDMMRELGVETPYFGYSKITVNGEDWGFYFALEAYDDSYKQRVSGNENGTLYNVKSMDMDMNIGTNNNNSIGDIAATPDKRSAESFFPGEFGGMEKGGGFGAMGAANSGGSLVYTDDNISSYSAIFGNVVGNGSEKSYNRVISALKALDSGEDIEKYFDVDEILRYLAVHSFVVNLDSYSSNMAQNYYIYEQDGVIKILPWDYNYAWGAFQGGTASDTVNFPIDTPVSGVEMSERPLISVLLDNEEYMERYHGYLNELLEKYYTNSKFNNKIDKLDNLISEYVKSDPTAFYTYEEYQTALKAFKNLGNLRAESVSGQLDGTVPSTTEEQKNAPDKLKDASSVTMSELGKSEMGGFGGFGGNPPENRDETDPNNFGAGEISKFNGEQPPQFDENNAPPDFPMGDNFNNNTNSNDAMTPQSFPDHRNGNDRNVFQNEAAKKNSGISLTVGSIILLIAAIIGVSLVKSRF